MASTIHNSSSRATRLEKAITNPGAVKINVKGAFIVDEDPRSKSPVRLDGVHYEGHDIRLPHHTGVVSHVAVDVSSLFFVLFFFAVPPHNYYRPAIQLQLSIASPLCDQHD
jgi:type II pantothenate kinase